MPETESHGMPDSIEPAAERAAPEGATLADVARLVGVSAATVSRALSRPGMVSEKTRKRIQAAVDQLGYVPNLLAGGLASNRSRLVAAIVPSIGTTMFSEAVETLSDRLGAAGYQLLLGISGFHRSREDELVAAVLSRRPDALVLTGIEHSPAVRRQIMGARIPVVECWDLTTSPLDMVVGFSHEKVGRAAALCLVNKGHRDIAVIAASDRRALRRRDGCVEALAEHGLAPNRVIITETPGSLALGRKAFAELAESGPLPRALVCTSDPLAEGALTEARVRGVDVPDRVAIIGFGDFPESASMAPALTTIRFDRRLLGSTAAQLILDVLGGRKPEAGIVDIGFEVIARETA
jgi:LacI family gluconate utilization system Gnt-I transcriptional repressor